MSRPIRRSQAIAPFGIGSLVDFPGPVSLVHASLDAWPFKEGDPRYREFIIDDEKRLSSRLDVDYFVQPPDFRQPERGHDVAQTNLNLKLPFLRFPLWHVCPRCGRMHLAQYQSSSAPICTGPIGSGGQRGAPHGQRKTVQVRFVGACKKGHLQDFPWVEWLFKQPNPAWQPNANDRWLRMRSTGSASLTGVEVSAEERTPDGTIKVVEKGLLASAFSGDVSSSSQTPLGKIGLLCEGQNPVLAIGKNGPNAPTGCGEQVVALLRGASNLYFPQVVSSIYIPDIEDQNLAQDMLDILDDHLLASSLLQGAEAADDGLISVRNARIALRNYRPESLIDPAALADAANKHILKDVLLKSGKIQAFLSQRIKAAANRQLTREMIALAIQNHCPDWRVDPSVLLPSLSDWFKKKKHDIDQDAIAIKQDTFAETDYRREEYHVFCRDVQEGYPKTNLLIRSAEIQSYGHLVRDSFERISLLHKLRETRAFVGFSRIFPGDDLTQDERWGLIAREKKRWLPAVIVRGEGIFLKFREDRLNQWVGAFGSIHETRVSPINRHMSDLRERRNQKPIRITPKHVLIHSFAHVLINELVFQCGYGSASLRERIYSADGDFPMSGVLIYTAAGDSEGTMGGLVRMGEPGALEDVVAKALEKARWCSSDPVCIESSGQGPDSCNLGACHSCALLPETSCEEQNRILDRGVVIGTIEHPDAGYFAPVKRDARG